MGKIRKTYTKEFKLEVIQKYLTDGWTKNEIAHHFKINPSMLYRWVRHYQEKGPEGLEENRGKAVGSHKGRPRKNPLSMEEEIIRLRAENEFLKKLWVLRKGEKA